MSSSRTTWPVKTTELRNVVLDSTRWNGFEFRDDDVVIASWSKTGTTLTQQIVAQLIFDGADDAIGIDLSPWIEFRATPDAAAVAAAQTHRRMLKTHLPLHALVFSPEAKYIYVGRDARDVVWSMHHHHSSFTPEMYDVFNGIPGRIGPPLEPPNPDVRAYYHDWLDRDGYPLWPFWSHVQSWWDARGLPNVLLVHFANLQRDLRGEIGRIAEFLGISVDPAAWPKILRHCDIDYMREQAARIDFLRLAFRGEGKTFINKGTNGRWRDVLSAAEVKKCDDVAARNLSPDCAAWLRTGDLGS